MKSKTIIVPRYAETDKMGIIHHSVYPIWYEQGRTDWCIEMDFPFHKIEELNIALPVININCNYKKSSRYGEVLFLYTNISFYSKTKLEFNYEIYNENNELINFGSSTHCWINDKGKPINIAKTHPEVFDMISQGANKK